MTATKSAILFAHRWLGFISGLVVLIISISGCIYCFHDEIEDVSNPYRKVEVQSQPFLLPSVFQDLALKKFPGGKITSVAYYGKDRSVLVRVLYSKKVMALFYNPYTGELLKSRAFKDSFFAFIKDVHLYLFLPKEIGKVVNYVSVIVFLIIMITGLVLWWPTRKSDRKRSFTIKWRAKWKRVNYDLHNVLGFYVTAIAMIVALTGLSFTLPWMNKGIYNIANFGRSFPAEKKKFQSDSITIAAFPRADPVIDQAYLTVRKKSPHAGYILLFSGSTASSPLSVTAYPSALHFSHQDTYAFDQYSGKLLNFLPDQNKSAGMKLNAMNYDIHTGQIAGFAGKIIAFLSSLICATLPVTGLILYLGKKKKSKKKPVVQRRPEKALSF
jgi:uncharacterized iron-regulated membrane protein